VKPGRLDRALVMGELSLDGSVRAVRGVLPIALHARREGFAPLLVPVGNAAEASVVAGVEVIAIATLHDAVEYLNGEREIAPARPDGGSGGPAAPDRDGLVAGLLSPGQGLLAVRPFRSPHHTASEAGLIGGGGVPHPGEISLAHHGVLFLDELPEFSTRVLEALRQPLEDARVVVSRAAGTVAFPARFQLVAAANPCRRGCPSLPSCACSPPERVRYLGRLSRPLLDRIDLHLEIPALSHAELTASAAGEPSAAIRARVVAARARQVARFAGTAIHANARMSGRQTRRICTLPPDAARLLGLAVTRLGLSARAHDRLLRVARTIADLASAEAIATEHIAEAIQYRTLDRAR